jgi:hypothetical protein
LHYGVVSHEPGPVFVPWLTTGTPPAGPDDELVNGGGGTKNIGRANTFTFLPAE